MSCPGEGAVRETIMRRNCSTQAWGWAGAVILAAGLAAPVRAQDPDDMKRGVARVSLVNGEVSVQRGDSGDWVAASINAPVVTNDRISTAPNSRAEVQFDGANMLRIGGDAEVSFTQLEYGRYQMAVAHGTVTFRVLRSSNIDMEVDTPSISIRPSKQGAYRISVNDAGESEITARSGEVELFSPRGSQWVRSGQALMARGSASDPEFQVVRAAAYDDWDRWNDGRDQTLTRSAGYQYVGPGVYGVEDLDPYGSWVDVPGYGYSWRPLVVADWAPYRQGRWVWEDWYGWTWVSYEPWGWAPYHYGRWFYQPAFGWCWYPGAIGVRHYWSPALVAFFGFGGGGGVSFGFGNVGWVPLAPYEVFRPWWGRGFYGGWDYVNRSINITNVNITNIYRNSRVNNGFTAVSNADFRSGRFNNFVHASGDQLHQAGMVHGPIPIAPERANLHFSDRQNAFVPQRSSANTRFFTRQQPNPAPSVPFAQQRSALDPTNRSAEPALGINRGRFGEPGGQGSLQRGSTPAVRNDAGGWQRFVDPRGGQAVTPRAEQVAPRNEPATPSNNRGWGRFGEPSGTPTPRAENPQPQRQQFRSQPPAFGGGNAQPRVNPPSPPSRQESVRISPPVTRDRSFGGGGGGNFSAPRSEPRAPSGGGGASRPPSGGGGGSRNSGNSGGGNRGGHR